MELCWNKESPISPSALGSWFSFSSVISHELLTFGLFCKDYLPSVLQSFRPSVTSGQQTCFLRRPFPSGPCHLPLGKVRTLAMLQGSHALSKWNWSSEVTYSFTTTEGNFGVHDLACATGMPCRAAFRRSLTPVFYFVLMANSSDATKGVTLPQP